MRTFFSVLSGHRFLLDPGFVLWSSGPANEVENEGDHSKYQKQMDQLRSNMKNKKSAKPEHEEDSKENDEYR